MSNFSKVMVIFGDGAFCTVESQLLPCSARASFYTTAPLIETAEASDIADDPFLFSQHLRVFGEL